jgi:hypothetical protein
VAIDSTFAFMAFVAPCSGAAGRSDGLRPALVLSGCLSLLGTLLMVLLAVAAREPGFTIRDSG